VLCCHVEVEDDPPTEESYQMSNKFRNNSELEQVKRPNPYNWWWWWFIKRVWILLVGIWEYSNTFEKNKIRINFWEWEICRVVRRFYLLWYSHGKTDDVLTKTERRVSIIALMMEAVYTSETSVHFNVTTRRYIPEDSIHTRRRENLKSHTIIPSAVQHRQNPLELISFISLLRNCL
jgi:hypothetical protein